MSGRPITCSTMLAEPTGTVDLLTTMAPGSRMRRDLLGRRLDVGQVGRAVGALGRRHAQEDELRPRHRLDRRVGEGEVAGRHAVGHQLVEPGLHDRHAAGAQRRQPGRLALGQHDVVAEVRQRRRGRQAHVAGADDGHRAAGPCGRCADWLMPPTAARGGRGRAGPGRPASRAAPAARSGAAPCCRAPSRPGGAPAGAGRARPCSIGPHPLGVGAGLGQHRPHEAPPRGGAAVGHVEDPGPAVEAERHDRRAPGRP